MEALLQSSRTLAAIAKIGGAQFDHAVRAVASRAALHGRSAACNGAGSLHVTGIGKSGVVGQRLAASLRSLSVPSYFTPASDWQHGCLGSLREDDSLVVVSHSGTTAECVNALATIRRQPRLDGVIIAGIFSTLKRNEVKAGLHIESYCNLILPYPFGDNEVGAADTLGGRCPTNSILVQEALVNAILEQVIRINSFEEEDFLLNHPA